MSARGPRAAARLRAIASAFVLAALTAVAAGCGGGEDGRAVEVQALWYGTTADGAITGGVTPVDITAVGDDPDPLSVDLRGLQEAGAGPMWRAATAVAATQAALISGTDPRLQQLNYSLDEAIDGPSAGALLSVGSLAALGGSSLSDSTTMTGTVLPDGSVGPVTGIAEKVRAAAAAGFTRVLIPAGIDVVTDPRTGREVSPIGLGRSLGVAVTPVESVADAYAAMAGEEDVQAEAKPPPIHPRILAMLERRSRALAATARGGSAAPGSLAAEPARIATLTEQARRSLGRDDPVRAFTAAAEAALMVRVSEASARVRAAAKRLSAEQLTARLSREAQRSYAAIRARMRATAEFPVTEIAQLPALADTLSWGDFGLTSIRVAQERLKTAETPAEFDQIAQFLAVARFEAAVYLPACAESLRYLGNQRITDMDAVVDRLAAYTELIGYAADANRAYAKSIGLASDKDTYLAQLIDQSDGLTGWVAREFPELRSPTARPALELSVALLEYVETTQLVNNLTLTEGRGTDAPPNLIPIGDASIVRTQARAADEVAKAQIATIAAAGLDPSFVQWNSRWGADLSLGGLPGTTDEQKLHGLEFQWFAVLQARLLTGLSGVQQTP